MKDIKYMFVAQAFNTIFKNQKPDGVTQSLIKSKKKYTYVYANIFFKVEDKISR